MAKNIKSADEFVKSHPLNKRLTFHLDTSKFEKASDKEKEQFVPERESVTFFKDGMRRLMKNPIAVICLTIIILFILIVIFVPMFWPYQYDQNLGLSGYQIVNGVKIYSSTVDSSYSNLAPFQWGETELARIAAGEKLMPHIFGTDSAGRDYFIRVVYGTRVSLSVGFFASIIVLIIGLLYGSISGYKGGRTDMIMMRIVDVIYSIPDMVIIILLSVVLNKILDGINSEFINKLGAGMISIFVVFALLYWVSMARLIRGQVLQLKENEYVLAAKSIGASGFQIIKKHLLPNCLSIIIISTALQIPSAIFTESFLSFLGLGVNAPMPSLGSLASAGKTALYSRPYLLAIPSIAIFLIILSLNLFGDALRDAFDPKLKK